MKKTKTKEKTPEQPNKNNLQLFLPCFFCIFSHFPAAGLLSRLPRHCRGGRHRLHPAAAGDGGAHGESAGLALGLQIWAQVRGVRGGLGRLGVGGGLFGCLVVSSFLRFFVGWLVGWLVVVVVFFFFLGGGMDMFFFFFLGGGGGLFLLGWGRFVWG